MDIEQLFRLMCFNVFAHNRDDHSKNFSYLCDVNKKEWHLSPVYDLTYSSSFNEEQLQQSIAKEKIQVWIIF